MTTSIRGALHKHLIEEELKNGWRTGKWRVPFLQMLDADPWKRASDPFLVSHINKFSFIPDLWRITVEGEKNGWGHDVLVVEFLEVEVTSPVTPEKCKAYQGLYWTFDGTEAFHLRVFRKDRWGYILPLVTGATMTDLSIRGHRFPNE